MLHNIRQCQVTAWTITHSCAKYLKWKLPSDWETRDIPFHSRALQFEKVRLTELPDDKKESLIMLHMNKSSHFLNLDSSIGTENATKYILFTWHFIIFELGTLLSHHHEGRQIWNFAEMSKSQSDGRLQFKFFLHINGSLEYTNYAIEIPMEHFSGVS